VNDAVSDHVYRSDDGEEVAQVVGERVTGCLEVDRFRHVIVIFDQP
jgi:hypothetical protein